MPGGHGLRDRKGLWRKPGIGRAFQAEWPRLTLDRQTQQAVKWEVKQNLSKQGCGARSGSFSAMDQKFFHLTRSGSETGLFGQSLKGSYRNMCQLCLRIWGTVLTPHLAVHTLQNVILSPLIL